MSFTFQATTSCPCGLPKAYDVCCGVFHRGEKLPDTPEQLMRSRYSAFTKANMDYIVATMKSPASDMFNVVEARLWAQTNTWLGLEVQATGTENNKPYVEFIARFNRDGNADYLHEKSYFRKDEGKWFYIDGEGPRKRSSLVR